MKNKTFPKLCLLILIIFSITANIGYGQASICGDTDGNRITDIIDALRIAQCYVDLIQCADLNNIDVNCDGSITIVDALIIAQYYVGILTQMDCCIPQVADLNFYLEFNTSIYPSAYHYPQYSFWVKDSETDKVYSVFVTEFTADLSESTDDYRPYSLPVWSGERNVEKQQNPYPQIDAISGATPLVTETTITWEIPAELMKKDIEVYLEANISFDFNDDYTFNPNGQPSLVWMSEINTSNGPVMIEPPVIGHGHVMGEDNRIHTSGLSTITDARDLFLSVMFKIE